MALKRQSLTDVRCKNAKPTPGKNRKLFDGAGLFLEVRANGSKLWRLKYRLLGKEGLLALGAYPVVTLSAARAAANEAKRLVHEGIDPAQKRKTEKQLRLVANENTLEAIAREWHLKFSPNWAATHSSKVLLRLEKNVFPWLGARPIVDIKAPELLSALRRLEARGKLDTARRVRQYLSSVFRFAIATGRAERDVAADLQGAIATPVSKNYATLTDPIEIGELLRAIDVYEGGLMARTALALAPMLFCRPGELRGMEWSELNLDAAEWRIPPARQKLRQAAKRSNRTGDHIVPLAHQAAALLRDLHPLTGHSKFVFPSERSGSRAMSDGTVNSALRRLGFSKERITGHGFRHMASTALNEQGWSKDAIESQLAHKDENLIRGIYNQAKYLEERRRMMQAWADYLDSLKSSPGTVVGIRSKQVA